MHNDRRHNRRPFDYPGWISVEGEPLRKCMISDVSEGGAKLVLNNTNQIPEVFRLLLSPTARSYRLCEVRWITSDAIGVQYLRGNGRRSAERSELIF